jgi:hypothetical protein
MDIVTYGLCSISSLSLVISLLDARAAVIHILCDHILEKCNFVDDVADVLESLTSWGTEDIVISLSNVPSSIRSS